MDECKHSYTVACIGCGTWWDVGSDAFSGIRQAANAFVRAHEAMTPCRRSVITMPNRCEASFVHQVFWKTTAMLWIDRMVPDGYFAANVIALTGAFFLLWALDADWLLGVIGRFVDAATRHLPRGVRPAGSAQEGPDRVHALPRGVPEPDGRLLARQMGAPRREAAVRPE